MPRIMSEFPSDFKSENVSDAIRKERRHRADMRSQSKTVQYPAIGSRLRRTRVALGFKTLRAFAEEMGTPEDTLGKWELGKATPDIGFLTILKHRWGVTLDWILAGDPVNLPPNLNRQVFTEDDAHQPTNEVVVADRRLRATR